MRVQSGALDGKLLIEYYDSGYNFKKTMTLDLPLPVFGAFYETNDNYYILTGANNTEKDNTKEVYRVSKYSKDWKSQGSCSLFGANTTYPFDAGPHVWLLTEIIFLSAPAMKCTEGIRLT